MTLSPRPEHPHRRRPTLRIPLCLLLVIVTCACPPRATAAGGDPPDGGAVESLRPGLLASAVSEMLARSRRAGELRLEHGVARREASFLRVESGWDFYLNAQPGYTTSIPYDDRHEVAGSVGARRTLPGQGTFDINVAPALRYEAHRENEDADPADPLPPAGVEAPQAGFRHDLSASGTVRFPLWAHTGTTMRLDGLHRERALETAGAEYRRDTGRLVEELVRAWFDLLREQIELERTAAAVRLYQNRVSVMEQLVERGDRAVEELWEKEAGLTSAEVEHLEASRRFRESGRLFDAEYSVTFPDERTAGELLEDAGGAHPPELAPSAAQAEVRLAELARSESEHAVLRRALDNAPELLLSMEAAAPGSGEGGDLGEALYESVRPPGEWSFRLSAGLSLSSHGVRRSLHHRAAYETRDRIRASEIARLDERHRIEAENLTRRIAELEATLWRYGRDLRSRENVLENRRQERRQGLVTDFEVWDAEHARNELRAIVQQLESRKAEAQVLSELRFGQFR